jgi:signal transduction histidine kinase
MRGSQYAADTGPQVVRAEPRDSTVRTRVEVCAAVADQAARGVIVELTNRLLCDDDWRHAVSEMVEAVAGRFASGCIVALGSGPDADRWSRTRCSTAGQIARATEPLATAVRERGMPLATEMEDPIAMRAAMRLGLEWIACVPVWSRDGSLGTLTVLAESGEPELRLSQIEELGRLLGVMIERGRACEAASERVLCAERLLATVAHDLKNPLGVIVLSGSRVSRAAKEQTPVEQQHADAIVRAAQRMKRLLADILDSAAIDSGALTLRPTQCDVRAIVDGAIEAMAPLAADAGVVIANEVGKNLPLVWADAERIDQLLANLVGNALKFTPRGGVVTLRSTKGADEVAISISDTGVGIPRAQLRRVFDRFFRAYDNRSQGSGLGLAICKSIVELSGGRIDIGSRFGEGTTVTFTLPFA